MQLDWHLMDPGAAALGSCGVLAVTDSVRTLPHMAIQFPPDLVFKRLLPHKLSPRIPADVPWAGWEGCLLPTAGAGGAAFSAKVACLPMLCGVCAAPLFLESPSLPLSWVTGSGQ